MIESVNNELIKKYSKLNDKKYRDIENLFIVEGKHLVLEAVKKNLVVDSFSLDGSIGIKVSLNVMKKLSSLTTPPECLAVCKKLEEREISGNLLILDGIQDPGNLGTIIRSSVAFGINTIVASLDTVDLYNSKVIRSSEGMIFNINYLRRDLTEFLSELKNYKILVTDVNEGKNIKDLNIKENVALVMGNEGSGVRENIKKMADESVYIKMNEACESLNVGISTSILLYEMYNK